MSAILLGDVSEKEVIRRLAALLPPPPPGITGIGDDCAIVPPPAAGTRLALKSDPIIEGRHFVLDDDPLRVGHKALGRVLSDFAAMGADPKWVLINLVARPDLSLAYVEDVYRGVAALAARHNVFVIGGDVSAGEALHLHVFGVGETSASGALLRSGARAGDILFVTGWLGGSRMGRHLDFQPRLAEGKWLASSGGVTAMCDVSDGVATDVRHIAEASGLGCVVDLTRIPIASEAFHLSSRDGQPPILHALCDGEDFELLFTADPGRAPTLRAEWPKHFQIPLSPIGRMTDTPGFVVQDENGNTHPFSSSGFEHFRESKREDK